MAALIFVVLFSSPFVLSPFLIKKKETEMEDTETDVWTISPNSFILPHRPRMARSWNKKQTMKGKKYIPWRSSQASEKKTNRCIAEEKNKEGTPHNERKTNGENLRS